jgi:hypothetical protein
VKLRYPQAYVDSEKPYTLPGVKENDDETSPVIVLPNPAPMIPSSSGEQLRFQLEKLGFMRQAVVVSTMTPAGERDDPLNWGVVLGLNISTIGASSNWCPIVVKWVADGRITHLSSKDLKIVHYKPDVFVMASRLKD